MKVTIAGDDRARMRGGKRPWLTPSEPLGYRSARSKGRVMQHDNLARVIEAAFEDRERIGFDTKGEVRDAVEAALDLLDGGEAARRREDGRAAGSSTSG